MELIARVILVKNGELHIAMNNRQAVFCTANSLIRLLSDPYAFLTTGFRCFGNTTKYIYQSKVDLNDILGLTLISVYQDRGIQCMFPEIFQILFSVIGFSCEDQILNVKNLLSSTEPSDEKSFLLHFYMEFVNSRRNCTTLKRDIDLSISARTEILTEIIKTSVYNTSISASDPNCECIAPEIDPASGSRDILQESTIEIASAKDNNDIPEHFVSVTEYAKIHDRKYDSVIKYIRKGRSLTAVLNERGKWYLDPEEKMVDGRKNRVVQPKDGGTGKKYMTRKKNPSFDDIQEWIQKRELVSSKIRPYIRSYDEASYYEKKNYHEVCWTLDVHGGKEISALIIDINPEYYCEQKKKTNRQIIEDGGSPVVPGSHDTEEIMPVFELHHIGQVPDSPLATLPSYVHRGVEYNTIFHKSIRSTENLHTAEFEAVKKAFWKKYIEMYDLYGTFKKIPYLNRKVVAEKKRAKEAVEKHGV